MISCSRARHLFLIWLEENDPVKFLKSAGVAGNGSLDMYHVISMRTYDGEIFYRCVSDIDRDWHTIDIAVMHDGDMFENCVLNELENEDYLDYIADHYTWFSDEMRQRYSDMLLETEIINQHHRKIMKETRNKYNI